MTRHHVVILFLLALIGSQKLMFLAKLLTFRRSSIGTFIRSSQQSSESSATSSQSNKPQKPQAPKLDYRSMVSIDDMPALFVSFDSEYWPFFGNENSSSHPFSFSFLLVLWKFIKIMFSCSLKWDMLRKVFEARAMIMFYTQSSLYMYRIGSRQDNVS